MNSTEGGRTERGSVARYVWLVTAAITVLFVIAPFAYTASRPGSSKEHFDPFVNLVELVGIAGCMSAVAFFILALLFRKGGRAAQKRSPSAMRRSLDQGLILTLCYWLLFIALSSTGGDADGIMRGWMVILYPVVTVSYVLLTSYGVEDR